MFKRNEISVIGWMLLIILINIPFVNVVVVVWSLLSDRVNKTLKNFFLAYIVFWVLSFFGIFSVTFENFQGLFG